MVFFLLITMLLYSGNAFVFADEGSLADGNETAVAEEQNEEAPRDDLDFNETAVEETAVADNEESMDSEDIEKSSEAENASKNKEQTKGAVKKSDERHLEKTNGTRAETYPLGHIRLHITTKVGGETSVGLRTYLDNNQADLVEPFTFEDWKNVKFRVTDADGNVLVTDTTGEIINEDVGATEKQLGSFKEGMR